MGTLTQGWSFPPLGQFFFFLTHVFLITFVHYQFSTFVSSLIRERWFWAPAFGFLSSNDIFPAHYGETGS